MSLYKIKNKRDLLHFKLANKNNSKNYHPKWMIKKSEFKLISKCKDFLTDTEFFKNSIFLFIKLVTLQKYHDKLKQEFKGIEVLINDERLVFFEDDLELILEEILDG